MAEEKSGWSNLLGQSGVVNYPLLGLLPNIYSKGYQYQSQPSYPQRDARGDWGRAINESLNQYFSQLPQYYQQVRANQLTQQQIAQQKIQQERETKKFNLQMQEVERIKKQRENWPQTVASLPLSDSAKKFLTKQGFDNGAPLLKTLMAEHLKLKNTPKSKYITKELAKKMGNPALEGSTQKPDGTIDYAPKHILESQQTGGVSASPKDQFFKTYGLGDKNDMSPQNVEAWNKVSGPSDVMRFFGDKPSEFMVRSFIKFNFPEYHPAWKANKKHEVQNNIKVSNNGSIIRIDETQPTGKPKPQPKELFNLNVPRMPPGQELTLDKIVKTYKDKHGIIIDPMSVVATNPNYFPTSKPGLMLTTEEAGGQELVIPQTNTKLNQAEASAIRSDGEVRNEYKVPLGNNLQATIIPPVVSPFSAEQALNQKFIKNVRATESAREFRFLAGLGKEQMSLLPVGRIKGLTEALSWRIIADIQKEREFGVLSPSEITAIKKSVPNPNDWLNYLLYDYGDEEKGRQYVQASMDAYLEELEGTKRALQAELGGMRMRGMEVNEWDYVPVDWTAKYDPELFKKSKDYKGPITQTTQQNTNTFENRNAWALDLLKSLAE
tara:strand:- start:5688 stop:7508 length:1821 start_codon:yes stop_codon:yes gene_type:complete